MSKEGRRGWSGGAAELPRGPLGSGSERAFSDDSDFGRLEEPKPGEWLYHFRESAQTFEDYVRSNPPGSTRVRRGLVIRAVGEIDPGRASVLDRIREYCEIYFDRPTELGPSLPTTGLAGRERWEAGRSWIQYRTTEILESVLEPELPRDAICLMGITLHDLYPHPDWNYVFGQASTGGRVGVYSLARYFPDFWGRPDTPEARHLGLARGLKVLTHETGHMLGLTHCVFYRCGMNGSNSLDELDHRPAETCPVCLKKIHWNLEFDPIARHERLEAFYRRWGLAREADWERKRLATLKAPAPPPERERPSKVRGSR